MVFGNYINFKIVVKINFAILLLSVQFSGINYIHNSVQPSLIIPELSHHPNGNSETLTKLPTPGSSQTPINYDLLCLSEFANSRKCI